MDNVVTILSICSGATFVCLLLVKRKPVQYFLGFLLIMFLVGLAVKLLAH